MSKKRNGPSYFITKSLEAADDQEKVISKLGLPFPSNETPMEKCVREGIERTSRYLDACEPAGLEAGVSLEPHQAMLQRLSGAGIGGVLGHADLLTKLSAGDYGVGLLCDQECDRLSRYVGFHDLAGLEAAGSLETHQAMIHRLSGAGIGGMIGHEDLLAKIGTVDADTGLLSGADNAAKLAQFACVGGVDLGEINEYDWAGAETLKDAAKFLGATQDSERLSSLCDLYHGLGADFPAELLTGNLISRVTDTFLWVDDLDDAAHRYAREAFYTGQKYHSWANAWSTTACSLIPESLNDMFLSVCSSSLAAEASHAELERSLLFAAGLDSRMLNQIEVYSQNLIAGNDAVLEALVRGRPSDTLTRDGNNNSPSEHCEAVFDITLDECTEPPRTDSDPCMAIALSYGEGPANALAGARVAVHSNNPDKARHFAISMREAMKHFINRMATDEAVQEWASENSEFVRATLKMPVGQKFSKRGMEIKILYIQRAINVATLNTFLCHQTQAIYSLYDMLNQVHDLDWRPEDSVLIYALGVFETWIPILHILNDRANHQVPNSESGDI